MKPFDYLLAALLGAGLASLLTWRILDSKPVETPVVEAPSVRMAPASAPVPELPAGPTPEEIAQLRADNAALAAQLAEAKARLIERDATLVQTKEQLAELRRPMDADIMSSALRAELKSGEVIVTGGYRLPDGRRLYAFAQPIVTRVDGEDRVTIQGRLLSLTEESGKTVGLDNLSTNAANTLQHGEVWVADEQQDVLGKLSEDPTADLLTMPGVTVKAGGSTTIEIGDIKLRVTPALSGDQGAMNMELRLEQPQVPAPVAVPPVDASTQPAAPVAPAAAPTVAPPTP
jgi:hypothetical protein